MLDSLCSKVCNCYLLRQADSFNLLLSCYYVQLLALCNCMSFAADERLNVYAGKQYTVIISRLLCVSLTSAAVE